MTTTHDYDLTPGERVPGFLGFHKAPPDVSPQRAENQAIEADINARLADIPGAMAFSYEDAVELDTEFSITTDKHNNRVHVLEELSQTHAHIAARLFPGTQQEWIALAVQAWGER